MNALADYILDWRPKCDIPEVFLTVKAPYRRLSKGFSIVKKQEYPKVAFRGFHSLRRSFETVMVSKGVPIETASQMMGHKSITEDKPYLSHDTHQISFVVNGFFRMCLLPAGSILDIQKAPDPWRRCWNMTLDKNSMTHLRR